MSNNIQMFAWQLVQAAQRGLSWYCSCFTVTYLSGVSFNEVDDPLIGLPCIVGGV
jgi:hypothetical protein